MCHPILIGVAIGAAVGATTAAITGGDPLTGAIIGGITGGVTGGMGGLGAGSMSSTIGGNLGASTSTSFINAVGSSVTQAGALGFGALSLGGSLAMGLLTPQTPDYSQYGYGAQAYEPQGFSSQHATVTGSGGRQAAAVLAEEIKRSRTLRQRQQEDTTAYNVAGELASTGLQIA